MFMAAFEPLTHLLPNVMPFLKSEQPAGLTKEYERLFYLCTPVPGPVVRNKFAGGHFVVHLLHAAKARVT